MKILSLEEVEFILYGVTSHSNFPTYESLIPAVSAVTMEQLVTHPEYALPLFLWLQEAKKTVEVTV